MQQSPHTFYSHDHIPPFDDGHTECSFCPRKLKGLISQDARYEPDNNIDTPSTTLLPPLEELYMLTVSQKFLESQKTHQKPPPDS